MQGSFRPAGTIWWIHPRLNIAGVLMTQRYFGFGNPYCATRCAGHSCAAGLPRT